MQPNQQDLNNQTPPARLSEPSSVPIDPYGRPLSPDQIQPTTQGIPEYLHMEPVVPPKPKKKPFLIMIPLLVLVFVGIAGAVAYFMMQQDSPSQRFYTALENQMAVTNVSREYKVTNKSQNSTMVIKAQSNLSNPAQAKSYITYSRNQVSADSTKKITSGEEVIDNANDYTAILKVDDFKSAGKNIALNQWYRIPINSKNRDSLTYDLDDIDSRLSINSAQGVVLTGNFGTVQRQSLIETIKTKSVYSLLAAKDIGNTTVYTVSLNRAALNELNKQAAELLDIKQVHLVSTNTSASDELTFTIDNKTQKITNMKYVLKNIKNQVAIEKNIDFNYPASVAIINPTNIKDLPK